MPLEPPRALLATAYQTITGLMRRRAVGDTGALAGAKYAGAGIGLVTAGLAARWLGPDPFGQAVLAISYCDLLLSLTGFKTSAVATHYLSALGASGKHDQAAAVFKLSVLAEIVTGTTAGLLAVGTAPWLVPWLFPGEQIETLVVTLALSLPFAGLLGAATAGLNATGRFRELAAFAVGERLTTLGLVVAALVAGLGAWGYLAARVLSRTAFNLVMLWHASRALRQNGVHRWWRASLSTVAHLRGQLQAFFGWNYVSVTCTGLMEQIPIMLLGRFAGSADAGYFSLGRSLVNVASYLETTLGQVTYPKLSAWSETLDPRTSIARAWRWSWRAGLPVALLIIVGALLLPIALPVALGAEYTPMVGGAQVLLIGASVSAVVFWVQPFYFANARIGQWTRLQLADTLAVIALMSLVVPAFGWLGLCWLVAVNRSLFRGTMAWLARRAA